MKVSLFMQVIYSLEFDTPRNIFEMDDFIRLRRRYESCIEFPEDATEKIPCRLLLKPEGIKTLGEFIDVFTEEFPDFPILGIEKITLH